MTIDHAAGLRLICEQQIQALLTALVEATGLDLRRVEVMTAAVAHGRTEVPHVVPFSVRVDLTV